MCDGAAVNVYLVVFSDRRVDGSEIRELADWAEKLGAQNNVRLAI
jgi:hypothetical protein